MRVRRKMTRDVVWVSKRDPLADVYQTMMKEGIRHVKLLGNRKL